MLLALATLAKYFCEPVAPELSIEAFVLEPCLSIAYTTGYSSYLNPANSLSASALYVNPRYRSSICRCHLR